jgi:hypothetical protein
MSDGNNANIDNKDSNGANKNADEFDNMEINKIWTLFEDPPVCFMKYCYLCAD